MIHLKKDDCTYRGRALNLSTGLAKCIKQFWQSVTRFELFDFVFNTKKSFVA